MVLDDLGSSLRSSLDKLKSTSRLSEEDIESITKEIQRALLQADVDVSLVTTLSDTIKERALEEQPPAGTTARDHVLRIVYEELVELVGESTELPLESQTILLAGLQGSGKTTTSAKIARWFSSKGLKPAVIQTDTDRPGAYDQSKELCERAEVDFYGNDDADNPVEIAKNGLTETSDADVRIVDTAGRHALEDDLITQIEEIEGVVSPDTSLLVIDAAIGQGAKEQALEFDRAIGIEGVVVTKLDGTAKGGGALTAVNETQSSIAFLGTGETIKDIDRFEPGSFISRLLGMGDLQKLAERVELAFQEDGEEDDWDPEDLLEGEFTLRGMRKQMQAMNEMGPLDQVMDMIPGMGGGMGELPDDAMDITQERMRTFEVVMNSLSEEELENPDLIDASRTERIARGSGTSAEAVRDLLKQYNQMSKTLNQVQGMQQGDMQRMMKRFQGQNGQGGLGR